MRSRGYLFWAANTSKGMLKIDHGILSEENSNCLICLKSLCSLTNQVAVTSREKKKLQKGQKPLQTTSRVHAIY